MKDMQIKVFNREKIEKFETDMPHIVISVHDPDLQKVNLPNNPNRIAELYLAFHDFDTQHLNNTDKKKYKLFTPDDAKSILTMVKLTLPYINTILINCEAGISRSSAIAASLSIVLGIPDTCYFDLKGPYLPNRLVYQTMLDTALEMGMVGGNNAL